MAFHRGNGSNQGTPRRYSRWQVVEQANKQSQPLGLSPASLGGSQYHLAQEKVELIEYKVLQ